jgi:transcriptional regulator GlxA family with amidase domain
MTSQAQHTGQMPRDVYFIVLPQTLALDITGPAETLRLAGQYQLHYISPQPQVVVSTGLTLAALQPLPSHMAPGSIIVIPGVIDSASGFASQQGLLVRSWLRQQKALLEQGLLTLACICSGSLLAGLAGLLDGYQCTTHHNVIARLRQQVPLARVQENRIFVQDRQILTSAGITAGIDLALYMIANDSSEQNALSVAQEMVVYFRRTGNDPQLSPWLRYRNHLNPALHRAQDLLAADPESDWPVAHLAQQTHISGRHLSRLFRQHLGISIHDYHLQLRVAVAQQRLQQGFGIEKAALAAGFSSARQLRRAQQREQINL